MRIEKEVRAEIERLKEVAGDELAAHGVDSCQLVLQMISALNWVLEGEL